MNTSSLKLRTADVFGPYLQAVELRRHLTFRDDLRSNPDAVAGYSRVKEEVVNDKMTLVFYEKHID